MDERLLEHYETELRHLRETAVEFARDNEKIAGRLALEGGANQVCPDPYVERLLEGFAYLAARIHLKLDSEFPRFTQSLLETVYPHYLSPIPSMAVVRYELNTSDLPPPEGHPIPRGTLLRSTLGKGERTVSTFQTAHPLRLLPVQLAEWRYFLRDLGELRLPPNMRPKAALRMRLEACGGVTFKEIVLSPLTFHLTGSDDLPVSLYEQLVAGLQSIVLSDPDDRSVAPVEIPAGVLRAQGFSEDEALLPPSPRTFEGYRLLREYFAFPQRFLFFELAGEKFAGALKQFSGRRLDISFILSKEDSKLEGRVTNASCVLACTPVINLFPKQLDRINLSDRFSEFHVVPEQNRPLDFEVFEILGVTGYGGIVGDEQEIRPFYLAKDTDTGDAAFYTTHRLKRARSARERQSRVPTSYAGTEIYLTLVDPECSPVRPELRQLGVRALCTNRHLPIQMATGVARSDFTMDADAPFAAIRCVSRPTLPRASLAEGRFAWKLISHLSLNYLSLVENDKGTGAAALREMLMLYTEAGDRTNLRQIEGLTGISSGGVLRRAQTPGPISFARGLEISITLDEEKFTGLGCFLLGTVLSRFFAKYVSINSFTETVLKTVQRGEVHRWPAELGKRPTI